MEAVFLKLVNMSITASWLVLAVIAVRLVFRKIPKWILCLLWGLVALRLIFPFSIESVLSLIPSAEPLPQEIIYTAHPEIQSGVAIIDEAVNPILESSLAPASPVVSANPTQIWSFILSQVWLLGLVLMILYAFVSYLLLKRKVATAIPIEKGIKQSEFVDSPFVLGILRPVIYLPFAMEEGDMAYVIAHERAHIRRHDHWWKPVGFLLLGIYWFNPVMWAAYILLCRDIEAACDEKVIKDMEKDDRRAYSTALLNCSIHRRRITACPLAFGEVGVKDRVRSVMNYKKPAFWIILIAVILSVILGVCFLTDPPAKNTTLMGAEYSIRATPYSAFFSNEEPIDTPLMYCITADYHLYSKQEEGDAWTYHGMLEPYALSNEELSRYMPLDEKREKTDIRKVTDAYILRVENDNFYLVFQTHNGKTYLAYGWEDVEERDDGASDDTQLRRLYQLENRFQVENLYASSFIDRSLVNTVGTNVDSFEYFTDQDFPGYALVGFMADGDRQETMRDMGFAVFQVSDEHGYRLLDWHVYENAALQESGFYYCNHPAVFGEKGTNKNSFDVILSCNENLAQIHRIYYRDGELIDQEVQKVYTKHAMTLFSWELGKDADTVKQIYYDQNGNEIPDEGHTIEKYSQKNLKEPEKIEIISGANTIYFEKGTEKYNKIWVAIHANWWKHTGDNAEFAAYDSLIEPEGPDELKTTSNRTYLTLEDTVIRFLYPSDPVQWRTSDGDLIPIKLITFILPLEGQEETNTRGFFIISQTENIGINEGLFTYYYRPELTNDFWRFLNTEFSDTVVEEGKTLSLNDVILLSQKGEELTLADLEGFACTREGSSLLYHREYPINASYYLAIGHSDAVEKPLYIWLFHGPSGDHVDVRQGNWEEAITGFINAHNETVSESTDISGLAEFFMEYSYEQVRFRMSREDVQFLGIVGEYALVFCSGEDPVLMLYEFRENGEEIQITGFATGEYAISGGLSVNHLALNGHHVYFGTITDSHWDPMEDSAVPIDCADLKFVGENGEELVMNLNNHPGYLCILDSPLAEFTVMDSEGRVCLDSDTYFKQGYGIAECMLLSVD